MHIHHVSEKLNSVFFLMQCGLKLIHHSVSKAVVILLKMKAVPVLAAKWVCVSEMWIILFVMLSRL